MQDIPAYAAMVESLDENIGRLLDTLHRSGLDERTIVVFTSDNGGMATSNTTRNIPTSNLPLRAGKGYLYEGGISACHHPMEWTPERKTGFGYSDHRYGLLSDFARSLRIASTARTTRGRSFHETRLTGRTAVQTFLILALSSL